MVPARDRGGRAQVLDARVRARADEHAADLDLPDRRAGLECHVDERALGGRARVGVGDVGRIGHDAVDRNDHARVRAPRDLRAELATRRSRARWSKTASSSVGSARQRSSACSHAAPFGAPGRPSRYANVVSSGAIIPARAPASIDMLQIVRRPSIDSCSITGPAYSITYPTPPSTPSSPIAASTMSFAVAPLRQLALERIRIERGLFCCKRLRREHVLDLGRADPERERPERAVRRRVRVAAHDRHARLRDSRAPGRSRGRCPRARCRSRRAGRRTPRSCPCSASSCCAESSSIGVSSPVTTL